MALFCCFWLAASDLTPKTPVGTVEGRQVSVEHLTQLLPKSITDRWRSGTVPVNDSLLMTLTGQFDALIDETALVKYAKAVLPATEYRRLLAQANVSDEHDRIQLHRLAGMIHKKLVREMVAELEASDIKRAFDRDFKNRRFSSRPSVTVLQFPVATPDIASKSARAAKTFSLARRGGVPLGTLVARLPTSVAVRTHDEVSEIKPPILQQYAGMLPVDQSEIVRLSGQIFVIEVTKRDGLREPSLREVDEYIRRRETERLKKAASVKLLTRLRQKLQVTRSKWVTPKITTTRISEKNSGETQSPRPDRRRQE